MTTSPDRLTGTIVPDTGPAPFEISAFGAANAIRDMNNDGIADIVKQTSLNPPQYVGVAYNEGVAPNQGFFDTYDVVNEFAPYFVSVNDLNNDGHLDMVVTDDGQDRYHLNSGAGFVPEFPSYPFSYQHIEGPGNSSDGGFGSNSLIVDLDNDGWNDVLIADVDVDISGCDDRMSIYRNLTGTPGGLVVLQEQTYGSGCQDFQGNPSSCVVAGIPSNLLEGVHDVAVFDIDGDGWKDMVLGRCESTEVYLNVPVGDPRGGVSQTEPADQLRIGKNGEDLDLSWGASCLLADDDYSIYEGSLGVPFDTHEDVGICSTDNLTSRTITPGPGSTYYLVVAHDGGTLEGSYGQRSTGVERPAAIPACRAQLVGLCE